MEPLDYSNRPLGETSSLNLHNIDPQVHNTAPISSTNMNMPNNVSKFQMNPMGHVYVQASTLMNSFMLQDGSHTYGSPPMSFAHLSHHFNSIRGQEQGGQPPLTQPNPNNFQYPISQSLANGSPVVSNTVASISASNENRPIVPDTSVSRPVLGSQVASSSGSTPYSNTTMNHSSTPVNSPTTNLPEYQQRNIQDVASTTNTNNNANNNTNSISSSGGQWSDQSETSDTKLSAQQLRLQRETQEERERRLVAGRGRMRLYRARERMLESPEEKERRLAIARERTRLGRALENAEQRERRLKKTRERLRMKRQMETQEERERRLKQHRENKRERYHKMSPDERSLLRRTGGQRTRSVSSGSSQSDGDLVASQRCNQRGDARNASLSGQWNNDMEGFSFGLDVKVEPDELLNRVDAAPPPPPAPTSTASSSLPNTTTGSGPSTSALPSGVTGSTDLPSLRLPPDKAPHSQPPPSCGAPLHCPALPNIVGGASATHTNFNYDFKPSPAGILQAIRPLRFGTAASPVATAAHYPNGPHLALTNYNHRDLCNPLNPL